MVVHEARITKRQNLDGTSYYEVNCILNDPEFIKQIASVPANMMHRVQFQIDFPGECYTAARTADDSFYKGRILP